MPVLNIRWKRNHRSAEATAAGEGHAVTLIRSDTVATGPLAGFEDGVFHQSPFAPTVQGDIEKTDDAGKGNRQPTTPLYGSPLPAAPEKELTLFAMRLAVLEKIATNVGTLCFVWATVVILGGYAITLKEIDFWFVTIILVIEGARIFSRSHELEWQHQDKSMIEPGNPFSRAIFKSTEAVRSTLSNFLPTSKPQANCHQPSPLSAQGSFSFRGESPVPPCSSSASLRRTWSSSHVSLFPFIDWLFRAKHISRLLYWMQLSTALLAITMSVYRLCTRHFTRSNESHEGTALNHSFALLIFYSLTSFELLVFLLERLYWFVQITMKKILIRVNERCGLAPSDLPTTRRFFYDVYNKCLTESIFEGLKMDMVEYAASWIQSDEPAEQFGGLRVLLTFSCITDCSEETLRTIGNRQGAVEKLLEMLTWKNAEEHEIRKAAAELLSRLVKHNRNCVRVAATAGSIEAIFSLLSSQDELDDVNYIKRGGSQPVSAKHLEIRLFGLSILKNLAKNPLNCAMIGHTRGLLTCLISFIDSDHHTLQQQGKCPVIRLMKKSLELLSLLSSATGLAGKILRDEISKVVYTVSNLRKILEHAQADGMVLLAVEVLSSMAKDDALRDTIGRTGGVMRNLLRLFIRRGRSVHESAEKIKAQILAKRAGEALALLALKNEHNCMSMMRLKVTHGGVVVAVEQEDTKAGPKWDMVAVLIEMVEDWDVGDLAMNILRSFCAYTEMSQCKLRIANDCMHLVVKLVVERTGRTQEAALGLLAKIARELSPEAIEKALDGAGVDSPKALARRLAELLESHHSPSTLLPRVRRYAIEVAMTLVHVHPTAFLREFQALNFRFLLHRVADTASELENYATFHGANGVTHHRVPMWQLVELAISKLQLHHIVSP